MRFDIITIFPNIFQSYFNESIINRAKKKSLVEINIHNLRDYANDRHKTVDDKPYGGGFGMVLMAEPILKAVEDVRAKFRERFRKRVSATDETCPRNFKIILLSPKGKKFDQKMAKKFSMLGQIILICGRYEGVDERVAKYIADEEISIGDYILTGGELPAMIVVDAVTRLMPEVINKGSLKEETFSYFLKENESKIKNKKLKIQREYPHYTRPEKVVIDKKKRRVPKILLSGNHKKIENWQRKHSERI